MPTYHAPLTAIDVTETRRYAGLNRARFDEAKLMEAAEEAHLLAAPKGIWQRYPYDATHRVVLAATPFAIEGDVIGTHLAGCEEVIIMAATVGSAIESRVTALFDEGRYAHAVLLDAAATTAVEQVADGMERALKNALQKEGIAMRWRFSPGYGDWPLEAQPSLLALAGGAEIGITMTEALMLVPQKSITAIIGLSRAVAENAADASCGGCTACAKTDCPARKANETDLA